MRTGCDVSCFILFSQFGLLLDNLCLVVFLVVFDHGFDEFLELGTFAFVFLLCLGALELFASSVLH